MLSDNFTKKHLFKRLTKSAEVINAAIPVVQALPIEPPAMDFAYQIAFYEGLPSWCRFVHGKKHSELPEDLLVADLENKYFKHYLKLKNVSQPLQPKVKMVAFIDNHSTTDGWFELYPIEGNPIQLYLPFTLVKLNPIYENTQDNGHQ